MTKPNKAVQATALCAVPDLDVSLNGVSQVGKFSVHSSRKRLVWAQNYYRIGNSVTSQGHRRPAGQ